MLRRETSVQPSWCGPRRANTAAWWNRRVSGPEEQPVGKGACDQDWVRGWRQVGRETSATPGTLETCERDLGAAGLGVSRSGQRCPRASCLSSLGEFALLRGWASYSHPRPSVLTAAGLGLTVTFVCYRFVWASSRQAPPAVAASNLMSRFRGGAWECLSHR